MSDALVISDLHLGSDNCQARSLIRFLNSIRTGERPTRKLILNGDLFDSIDFRRLNKHHWKVLSLIRKLSDDMEIIWLNGNHDGNSEIVSHLLGVEVHDEYILDSGHRRILFMHGHRFDQFIDKHPILTAIADRMYSFLQKIDSSHRFARYAKKRSKTFLRCAEVIEKKGIDYARKLHCDAIACGHTHMAVHQETGDISYYNSGCWTEKPCHYLAIVDGVVTLHEFVEHASAAEIEVEVETILATV